MTRPPVRPALLALALALPLAAPLSAQESPGSFNLPPASPTPSPAPAGPADERAGVAIPPRDVPTSTPTSVPGAAPAPAPTFTAQPVPTARVPGPAPTIAPRPGGVPNAAVPATAPAAGATLAPEAPASDAAATFALPTSAPALPDVAPDIVAPAAQGSGLPDWWPYAAGGLGAIVMLGGGMLAWRRRKPKVLRLAAPAATAGDTDEAPDFERLDLTLEITSATRSLMRFTMGYRLTIANRSGRAVQDARIAVQLACARASGGSGPSAGAAQSLGEIARIGPHQAQSITGEVGLSLGAIQPLRQGATPLFIPLVHITLEGEGQRALSRTFVVGPRSASGRVHPIALD
ncbi:MAG: hypothetical protein ACKO01_06630, partial [Erythrobacter sp.]